MNLGNIISGLGLSVVRIADTLIHLGAVTGGVQFDRADVAASLDQAKGYTLYISELPQLICNY